MTDQTPSPQSVVVPVDLVQRAINLLPVSAPRKELSAMLAAAPAPSSLAGGEASDNPLTFGMGALVVNTGKFGGDHAVFIARAKESGEVGAYTGKSAFDRKTLQPGELVMIFPTEEQVQVVADALVGALTPRHEAPAEGAGERERLADAYIAGAMSVHEYWTENPGEAPRGDPEFDEAAGDYAYSALATREEAPAEAGERDYPAEFEAWWATYRHRNRDVADYPVKKQIAFDAFYFGARAQPQAREDAQPVHCQSCGGEVQGWTCQGCGLTFCERDGRLIAERHAPDALRVAVEALEPFAQHPDFHAGDDWPVTFVNDEERVPGVTAGDFRRARQALAALQAEQGAK